VHPDDLAILAQVALLGLERSDLSAAQLSPHAIGHVQVVRMRDLLDGHAQQLVAAVAEQIAERAVHLDQPPMLVDMGDPDRGEFDGVGKSFLAFAQPRLRQCALVELADLAADVAQAIEPGGIEVRDVAYVNLNRAQHLARAGDWKRKGADHPGRAGQHAALVAAQRAQVAHGHRLAFAPCLTEQTAGPVRAVHRRHRVQEGHDGGIGFAPGAHAAERCAVDVGDPAGAAGPAELLADQLHQRVGGLVQVGGVRQALRDRMLDREPMGVA
jgi:hypothetical protein